MSKSKHHDIHITYSLTWRYLEETIGENILLGIDIKFSEDFLALFMTIKEQLREEINDYA